jgi:hypothetical protein
MGARSVVAIWLSIAYGVDALKIITNFFNLKWASTPAMGDKGPYVSQLIFQSGFDLVLVVSNFKLETGTSNRSLARFITC